MYVPDLATPARVREVHVPLGRKPVLKRLEQGDSLVHVLLEPLLRVPALGHERRAGVAARGPLGTIDHVERHAVVHAWVALPRHEWVRASGSREAARLGRR